jgi:HD-GYP domain-containing protein (c-di-GMP phosphodiesterase class II)
MTTTRSYRAAMSIEAAVTELCANAGTQFSPVVVEALLRVIGRSAAEHAPQAIELVAQP